MEEFNNYGQPTGGQQPQYQQPQYQQPVQPIVELEKPMTIGQWIGTILLGLIPCVNIILLIVWAASATNKSKKRWAIATLIVAAILIVLYIAAGYFFSTAIMRWLSKIYSYSDIYGAYSGLM